MRVPPHLVATFFPVLLAAQAPAQYRVADGERDVLARIPRLEIERLRGPALQELRGIGARAVPPIVLRLAVEPEHRVEARVGLLLALGALPPTWSADRAIERHLRAPDAIVAAAAREAALRLGPARVACGVVDHEHGRTRWYSAAGDLLREDTSVYRRAADIAGPGRLVVSDGSRLEVTGLLDRIDLQRPTVPFGNILSFASLGPDRCIVAAVHGLHLVDPTGAAKTVAIDERVDDRRRVTRTTTGFVEYWFRVADRTLVWRDDAGDPLARIEVGGGVVDVRQTGHRADCVLVTSQEAIDLVDLRTRTTTVLREGLEKVRFAHLVDGDHLVVCHEDCIRFHDLGAGTFVQRDFDADGLLVTP